MPSAPGWTPSSNTPPGNGPTSTYGQRTYYTPAADASYALYGRQQIVTHSSAVEGTYLDSYGVVFTVTLPATGRDPRPGATGPKETVGLSDWDREQKALRG